MNCMILHLFNPIYYRTITIKNNLPDDKIDWEVVKKELVIDNSEFMVEDRIVTHTEDHIIAGVGVKEESRSDLVLNKGDYLFIQIPNEIHSLSKRDLMYIEAFGLEKGKDFNMDNRFYRYILEDKALKTQILIPIKS